jgi:hypothetical protein
MGRRCIDCGERRLHILRLIHRPEVNGGTVAPQRASVAHDRAVYASAHKEAFCVRCLNCQSTLQPSPGRPPRLTDEQRAENRRATIARFNERRKQNLVTLFGGTCVDCAGPATRVCYVGPASGGPRKGYYRKSRARLIVDEDYRRDFAPYCSVHGQEPYFSRAKRGEVSAPIHWRA